MHLAFKQATADLIHGSNLTQCETVIILIATSDLDFHTPKIIQELAINHGVSRARRWNISSILTRNSNYFFKREKGWFLTALGKSKAAELGCCQSDTCVNNAPIRSLLAQVPSSVAKDFFEESVKCYENGCYRAAVILAWESSIGVLYDRVLEHCLEEFNLEATKRVSKWKEARCFDDFSNMKESTFLDILCAISVIAKSTKQELQGCLTLRNGCGHPNTYLIGPQRALGCIESLWNNVHKRFLLP